MNPEGGESGDGFNPKKMAKQVSSVRDLSQQLDALALEDDDDGDETFDPMNMSDFLNSKGNITGLSEWTDSEQEETCQNNKDAKRLVEDKPPESTNSKAEKLLQPFPKGCADSSENHCNSTHCGSSFRDRQHGINKTPYTAWSVPRDTASAQMFSRAPNFRTPGGYKPPLVEKEPRNLTDEQILLEVKEMYAQDRLDAQNAQDSDDSDKCKDSLDFLLNNSHFPERDGADRKQSPPLFEPEPIKSASWVSGNGRNMKDSAAIVSDFTDCSTLQEATNYVAYNRRSSNSRTENLAQLSRLWSEIQDTKQKLEHDINSLANPGSPAATSSPKTRTEGQTSVTTKWQSRQYTHFDPDKGVPLPRRSFSFGKRAFPGPPKFGETSQESVKTKEGGGDAADVENKKSPEKIRPKKTVRSKGKVQRHRRYFGGSLSQALVPMGPRSSYMDHEVGLEQAAIDEILQETDLHESDLDEILSEISDHIPDVGVSGVHNFFKQSDFLQEVQLSNAHVPETYKQKYFEERYRRDHCENEISKLQKQLLEVSEKAAVFDGILRGKDMTITKLNKQVERLQSQLKSQENATKEQLSEIETQTAELKSQVADSSLQISAYKKELDEALEVNKDLKVNFEGSLQDLKTEKSQGQEQKEQLLAHIDSLEASLTNAQIEKESSLRALKDCQDTLDTTKNFYSIASEELLVMKANNKVQEAKLLELEAENKDMQVEVIALSREKTQIASRITDIEAETEKLKSEKIILESDSRRKLTEEREKLHEYYNSKIKEILHKESQKMIEAEKEFVGLHEAKLEQVETDAQERLDKMRMKYTNQVQQMKAKFDLQMDLLRKENEDKSRLIGTVSEQLRNFSERDKEIVDKQAAILDVSQLDSVWVVTSSERSTRHEANNLENPNPGRGRLEIPQGPTSLSNGKSHLR